MGSKYLTVKGELEVLIEQYDGSMSDAQVYVLEIMEIVNNEKYMMTHARKK